MLNEKEKQVSDLQTYYFGGREGAPFRAQLINNEPFFVGKDLCQILGFSKYRDVLSNLDEDERVSITVDTLGGKQMMIAVNESGFYHLVFQSKHPKAKEFRRKVTMEVLPSIRKKGYYGVKKSDGDYLDARDVPYGRVKYQDGEIRVIEVDGVKWYSLNDVHCCIGSRTESSQSVKRLNAKRTLAKKIWIYGVTQPGWFVCELGVKLLLCASVKHQESKQLMLDFS